MWGGQITVYTKLEFLWLCPAVRHRAMQLVEEGHIQCNGMHNYSMQGTERANSWFSKAASRNNGQSMFLRNVAARRLYAERANGRTKVRGRVSSRGALAVVQSFPEKTQKLKAIIETSQMTRVADGDHLLSWVPDVEEKLRAGGKLC